MRIEDLESLMENPRIGEGMYDLLLERLQDFEPETLNIIKLITKLKRQNRLGTVEYLDWGPNTFGITDEKGKLSRCERFRVGDNGRVEFIYQHYNQESHMIVKWRGIDGYTDNRKKQRGNSAERAEHRFFDREFAKLEDIN